MLALVPGPSKNDLSGPDWGRGRNWSVGLGIGIWILGIEIPPVEEHIPIFGDHCLTKYQILLGPLWLLVP